MLETVPHIPEGSKILDIGTADGQLFKLLKHRIKAGLGIDPYLSEPVACARYRLIPGRFPEGIPKSEKFNVITMLAVIEHFPEDLLRQCDRICSDLLLPSGYVIITVPSKYCDTILKVLNKLVV